MFSKIKDSEQFVIFPQAVRWLLISSAVGILSGSASALFLLSLDWATHTRDLHLWLIGLLPLGGLLVGLLYHWLGSSIEGGNNLILEEIHNPREVIPLRMAPFIFLATVVTHLFGGSAGREGTALQMGASLADQLSRPLKIGMEDRRILLMAGISGGFASVFGTPLAGALFGLEVLAIGRLRYDAIFPCLIAAIVGDQVTLAWGVHHTEYKILTIPQLTVSGFCFAAIAGVCFGIVGMLFGKMAHAVSHLFEQHVSYAPLRPFIGGIMIALMVWILGSTEYIGLGIPTMDSSFSVQLPPWTFLGKFIFTVITLGASFKGGEVTPLFYIGATLGNALSYVLPLPFPLLSGMGFVGVFAGAANTPISSIFMAIELFGQKGGVYVAIACVVSYLFSGHAGIYHSQLLGHGKHRNHRRHEGLSLAALQKVLDQEKKVK